MSALIPLPDCDSIDGAAVRGPIVEIQYRKASGERYSLSMTVPNAQYLLSLLCVLPDADRLYELAKASRDRHPTG